MRRWGFYAVALANGSAEEAFTATEELLNRFNVNSELTSWARRCSFRVVSRAELEAFVQVTLVGELDAELRKEISLEVATNLMDQEDIDENTHREKDATQVALTPSLLALAFQRLVARDKQEFLAHQKFNTDKAGGGGYQMRAIEEEKQAAHSETSDIAQTPARIYLLVDYPSSLSETEALLRLGEIGNELRETGGPEKLPLLPLIDGVILIADFLDSSAFQGQSSSDKAEHIQKPIRKIGGEEVSTTSMNEMSVFQTANVFVKMLYEAAQVGGAEWSDFTFTHVTCRADATIYKKPEDLELELVTTITTIAAQKFAFKDWVASIKYSVIPGLSSNVKCEIHRLYKQYEMILRGIFAGSVAVSTVLYAIIEAVAIDSIPCISSNICQNNQSQDLLEYGDLAACRVASAQFYHEMLQADGNPCFLPYGKCRLDDIEKNMWQRGDLPGVANQGRKKMPRKAKLTEPERSVCDTEFASFFTSPRLSCSMVHRTRQLLQIEEMLGSSWRGNLQSREYSESLTRTILPQRIAQVLREYLHDTHLSYYEPTDSFLLACLPKTTTGRLKVSTWVARDHVRHRSAFKEWKREQLLPQECLTTRTGAAAEAYIPLSSGQLALVATKSWSMYPADHNVICLYQTPRGHVWLTVNQKRITFGLRPSTEKIEIIAESGKKTEKKQRPALKLKQSFCFIASFQDESTLYTSEGRRNFIKKPDQQSTIVVTNSFPSGLIVSACSDGCVIQRYANTSKTCSINFAADCTSDVKEHGVKVAKETRQVQECDEVETYRVVYGNGSVLRVLQCGRREVMLANGFVRVLRPCKNHQQSSRNSASPETKSVTLRVVDPETHALVERHANGVVIVTFTSGARVTYHLDGTRMYTNAARTHILVTKRCFADVCIDVKVNVTAQHHAAGELVTVTKGGLRVRSIVNVYDGTRIEIGYNTKVTAQVNGRVTTYKPKGQVIVAKDSGRVEVSTSEDPNFGVLKDDDDRDVTDHCGVYYFDCHHGQFQLCDSEQNKFQVDFCGTNEEPSVLVDLAGEISEKEGTRYNVDTIPARAVINEPIQPHIFILNGDGIGVEILRPQDIAEFIEDCGATDDQVKHFKDVKGTASRTHLFLPKLDLSTGAGCEKLFFGDKKLHEEMLELQRPVGTAGKYLPTYYDEMKYSSAQQKFTVVRRVEQTLPLSTEELHLMHTGWAKWELWRKDRETERECYKVENSRQPEVIAQEVVMQKKVMAAYKQSRARKKVARQKAQEMKAANTIQDISLHTRMDTVQEFEEELKEAATYDEDINDGFSHFGSDSSNEDISDIVEVDNPIELLWSTFSQADAEGRGLLSVAQTRLGLANILGIGVITSEIIEALVWFKAPYPYDVSFNVFADLVEFFRSNIDENHIMSLKRETIKQCKEFGMNQCAAGSAAEAFRARHGNID